MFTLKINDRNDIHLPSKVLRFLASKKERLLKLKIRNNSVILNILDTPYSTQELKNLDCLHQDQKKKGFIHLKQEKDIDNLLK